MGVILIAKVVIGIDKAGRPKITQLGNREQVTVIKAIYIQGFIILVLVIFKAVIY